MKRAGLGLLAAAVLAACSHSDSGESRGPASGPTFPPVAAFKDGLLYAAIKAKLAGMDIDSTTRVSVIVRAGVATLRGEVPSQAAKARDIRIVRDIRGVTGVNDELRVGPSGRSAAQTVRDAALVAAVESALLAQTGVNVSGVRVGVSGGTVTLAGHAPSAAVVSTMLAAARKTPGVRNVIARIAVKE